MAYTTIDKPTDYFNTKLYTGNGSTQSITGLDFAPSWVWIKQRDIAENHETYDAVRGVTKALFIDQTGAEATKSTGLTSFNSDGFSLGNRDNVNKNSGSYASWNWKETATAGFDIVSYTGNDTARTISHSLSAVPTMMIVKCRDVAKEWTIFHASLGNGKFIELDQTTAVQTATNRWNDTSPTSSVFTVGVDSSVNGDSQSYIAYLFSEKKGYSKFGSYTGNGNADGAFVYTGFKPAWLLAKKSSGTGDWFLIDNKRSTINPTNHQLEANSTAAEDASGRFDFLSNGFKCVSSSTGSNGSGTTYIYMAFAESPLVSSSGVPTTAR